MARRRRLIALMTGAATVATKPAVSREPHLDPYAGTLTAPDLPQRLREAGGL